MSHPPGSGSVKNIRKRKYIIDIRLGNSKQKTNLKFGEINLIFKQFQNGRYMVHQAHD